MNGYPHTEALRVAERYRRRDFGHIDTEVTFEDRGAYAKPWTMAIPLRPMTDTSMIEYDRRGRSTIRSGAARP